MVASTQKAVNLGGLARKLVADGLLTEENALKHQEAAKKAKESLILRLVGKKVVAASAVATAAAREFGIPLIDINAVEIDKATISLVKEEFIRKHNALPLHKRGMNLFVAIADPTDVRGLNDIKFATGLTAEPVLAEADKLEKSIDAAMGLLDSGIKMGELEEGELEGLDSIESIAGGEQESDDDAALDDAPVVRFVNKVLLDAINKGASDVHFEPYEKACRVRFRIDGVLQEVAKPPLSLSNKITSRIKVMSRLDVSERRVPQDGRIKLKISKHRSLDFRVSTCPTLFGEKTCMRILDSDVSALQIEQLGYEEKQKEAFLHNLNKPYGMFLVTGPTGSGKTVSLYAGINILNTEGINISTAEDPVEINLHGVNQVQVDERTGMTFPKALKAFLRQDPDIILVGEVRDIETGSIAVKAAQTGHMVMSTLHTNDAPQTLTRLQDMGIAAFAVATSINMITAQRLCRRLHQKYRKPVDVPRDALLKEGFPEEWLDSKNMTLYEAGNGGEDCPSGYKGRTGIYQIMPISEELKRLIIEGANAVQLADQADAEGIWNIRISGLRKAMDGVTTLAEVNRVTVD